MKMLLAVLALSLAACASQRREIDTPDFTVEPRAKPTPAPQEREVDSLVSQARLDLKRRDYDEARVKLFQVFRRDRFHVAANTLYQDLQISRRKGDALYQEYLDLFERNRANAAALWFHLRPLLIARPMAPWPSEPHREIDESTAKSDAVKGALERLKSGDATSADAETLLVAWPDAPHLHMFRIDMMLAEGKRAQALTLYANMADENPQSGDSASYLATVLAADSADFAAAIEVLRKAWILELPGIHLPLTWGKLALAAAQARPSDVENLDESARQSLCWLNLALNFFALAAGHPLGKQGLQDARAFAQSRAAATEELTSRR